MIQALEAQMGDTRPSTGVQQKRKNFSTDADIHQDEVEDEVNVKDTYKQLMSKRRKTEQVWLALYDITSQINPTMGC